MRTAERPEDVEVEDAYGFLAPRLGSARRVLDVGCGNGLLARRLAGQGLDVTALDRSLKRVERTVGLRYVEADFLSFEDAAYDALVFSASLHHISPLTSALDAAHRLLRPGGRLLVTDFDVDAPDLATARWYYDVEGLLLETGLYRPEKVSSADVDDALVRWHAEHVETPPFHTGTAMREGLTRLFIGIGSARGPYLYRYVAGGVFPSSTSTAVTLWAHKTEQHHLATGALKPVGLRLWAQKAPDS
jgi:SAM-dependent methyltransferase